jgi:hypothetical protein
MNLPIERKFVINTFVMYGWNIASGIFHWFPISHSQTQQSLHPVSNWLPYILNEHVLMHQLWLTNIWVRQRHFHNEGWRLSWAHPRIVASCWREGNISSVHTPISIQGLHVAAERYHCSLWILVYLHIFGAATLVSIEYLLLNRIALAGWYLSPDDLPWSYQVLDCQFHVIFYQ